MATGKGGQLGDEDEPSIPGEGLRGHVPVHVWQVGAHVIESPSHDHLAEKKLTTL